MIAPMAAPLPPPITPPFVVLFIEPQPLKIKETHKIIDKNFKLFTFITDIVFKI